MAGRPDPGVSSRCKTIQRAGAHGDGQCVGNVAGFELLPTYQAGNRRAAIGSRALVPVVDSLVGQIVQDRHRGFPVAVGPARRLPHLHHDIAHGVDDVQGTVGLRIRSCIVRSTDGGDQFVAVGPIEVSLGIGGQRDENRMRPVRHVEIRAAAGAEDRRVDLRVAGVGAERRVPGAVRRSRVATVASGAASTTIVSTAATGATGSKPSTANKSLRSSDSIASFRMSCLLEIETAGVPVARRERTRTRARLRNPFRSRR